MMRVFCFFGGFAGVCGEEDGGGMPRVGVVGQGGTNDEIVCVWFCWNV